MKATHKNRTDPKTISIALPTFSQRRQTSNVGAEKHSHKYLVRKLTLKRQIKIKIKEKIENACCFQTPNKKTNW